MSSPSSPEPALIENKPDTALQSEWNVIVTEDVLGTHLGIQDGFDQSFQEAPYTKVLFPNELSEEKALPKWQFLSEGFFSVLASAIAILSSVALALLWAQVWTKTKEIYYAKTKSKERWVEFGMALLRAIAPTLILVLVVTLSASALIYAAPLVMGIVLGVGLIYGALKLGASIKRAYAAYQQHKLASKVSETNKPALKSHFISIFTNAFALTLEVLGFLMNYYLGRAMQEFDQGQTQDMNGYNQTQAGVRDYLQGKRIMEVLTIGAALSVISQLVNQVYSGFKTSVLVYSNPRLAYANLHHLLGDKITSLKTFWSAGLLHKFLAPFVVVFELGSMIKTAVLNVIPAFIGGSKALFDVVRAQFVGVKELPVIVGADTKNIDEQLRSGSSARNKEAEQRCDYSSSESESAVSSKSACDYISESDGDIVYESEPTCSVPEDFIFDMTFPDLNGKTGVSPFAKVT